MSLVEALCWFGSCLALTWGWNTARRELRVSPLRFVGVDARLSCVRDVQCCLPSGLCGECCGVPGGGSLWCGYAPASLRAVCQSAVASGRAWCMRLASIP